MSFQLISSVSPVICELEGCSAMKGVSHRTCRRRTRQGWRACSGCAPSGCPSGSARCRSSVGSASLGTSSSQPCVQVRPGRDENLKKHEKVLSVTPAHSLHYAGHSMPIQIDYQIDCDCFYIQWANIMAQSLILSRFVIWLMSFYIMT